MRSASLFVVLGLVFVLAVSSFGPVAASGYVEIRKVTTNGDTTTEFPFEVSGDVSGSFSLVGGGASDPIYPGGNAKVIVRELVPEGWYISDISCEGMPKVGLEPSTFEFIPGEGVIIAFIAPDEVVCTFTNSPVEAVGGSVIPANMLALVAPWLVVIGVVGCISAVVVYAKKRGK